MSEQNDLTFTEWLTEKHINQIEVEFDSLIGYLRQRERGERKRKSLILKRMKRIRIWLEMMEEMLNEEDRRLVRYRDGHLPLGRIL